MKVYIVGLKLQDREVDTSEDIVQKSHLHLHVLLGRSSGRRHHTRRHHHSWWGHALRRESGRRRRHEACACWVEHGDTWWRRDAHAHARRWWDHAAHLHWHGLRHHGLLRRETRRRWRLRKSTGELPLVWPLESWHWWALAERHRRWRRARGDGERVVFACLGGEETFGRCSVPFALAVLLERILHGDRLVHEELPVHGLNSCVR